MKRNLRLKKPHTAACDKAIRSLGPKEWVGLLYTFEKSIGIKYHSRGPEASLGHGF